MSRRFLYRRICDRMLMIHDPDLIQIGTPDCTYYEFNDKHIRNIAEYENIDLKATAFPRHVGVFVRDYVERNMTDEILNKITADDYTPAHQMIIDALKVYVQFPLKHRIKLHMKELDKIRFELYNESHVRLS